jgi:tRNA (guanine9-N1)-methyltransferase
MTEVAPSEVLSNETASPEETKPVETQQPTMSRNQQKKLARLERAMSMRAEKRKQEREKRKQNRKNNKAVKDGQDGQKIEIYRKALKQNTMAISTNKLRIVIDCSFESLMNESDVRHLCKQLSYCYANNRRMTQCNQLYFTSMGGQTEDLLNKSGLANWDVHKRAQIYNEVFANEPKENICYLTSDSPNELEDFDENKVYIIGGLVDHNHHKSLCYKLALEKKIMHYRLPINKFMSMRTRPVLTVNHVFEIICRYVECRDWKQAFVNTLPKRKGAEAKDESESDDKTKDEENQVENDQSDESEDEATENKKQKLDETETVPIDKQNENKEQVS